MDLCWFVRSLLGVNCSGSHSSAPAPQVAFDCGKLPLAIGLAAPLLTGPPQDPKSWRTLHEALHKAMTTRLGTDRVMTVPVRVDVLVDLSMDAMADDPAKQMRCLFLAVLAPGTLARSDMLQALWDEVRRGGVGSVSGVISRTGAILCFSHHLFLVEALLHKRVQACIGMAPIC